jgi:tetratricopeptide (TPR) repeat protein
MERIKASPEDFYNYAKLGEAFIAKARETGDTGWYERAAAALQKALALQPGDYDSLVALSAVDLARHEFAASVAHAREAAEAVPERPGAWAALGDALVNRGFYEEAEGAYAKLRALRPGLDSDVRTAQMLEMRGDPRGAAALLERVLSDARKRLAPDETIAFVERTLGDVYAASGRRGEAEALYENVLQSTAANRVPALMGLARLAACRGDDSLARAYAEKAVEAVPLPAFLTFLGDLDARSGDAEKARRRYALVAEIGRVGGPAFGREVALYLADHGDAEEAVRLARRELEVRTDVATYDVLSWALERAGRVAEAYEASREALRLGTRDARFLFHAGVIRLSCGETAEGRELLLEALETNPCFDVLQADEARRLLAR